MTSTLRTAALLCALLGLAAPAAFAKDAAKEDKKADKKSEKAAKPINKICPVEGGEIDPEVTVTHKGKVVAFCCAGCDEEFKKDPAKYLAIIAKEPKNKESDKGDAKHEGDTEGEKKEGDKEAEGEDDAKEAKLNAKCPVSGDDVDEAMTADYKGRTVAFCCEDCAKDFEKDPKKYLASLEAQDKAAAAKDDHDHDGDGKADHDEKDHAHDEEHKEEKSEKSEK